MYIRLALLCLVLGTVTASARTIPMGGTVAVLPLTFRYNVDQEYIRTVVESDASLKGYFRESSSASARSSYRDSDRFGMNSAAYSEHESAASRARASGDYDLKSRSRVQSEAFYDRTIVEKTLDSGRFTGILESALSEAGFQIADRSQLAKLKAERGNMKSGDFAASPSQKGSKIRIADYLLNGQIESMRLEGVRAVPDGTDRRFAVGGVVKISIKLTETASGVSNFAQTFTGKARKTFDVNDPIPAGEVMDLAMDNLAAQVAAALGGQSSQSGFSDEDSEYRDSPGKQLRE
ncbi:hypothetical protein MASR1M90_13910 [Desulfovibrionales bacterium]